MKSVKWENGRLFVLDQTKLPYKEEYRELKTYRDAGFAVSDMIVRGVSLSAVVIAYGMVLSMNQARRGDIENFREDVYAALDFFEKTRVSNVAEGYIARTREFIQNEFAMDKISAYLHAEADKLVKTDIEISAHIADNGVGFISSGDGVLTYSNYGALSSCGEGSAIAIIKEAYRRYGNIKVYCCETRPYLQGSRLSAWELKKAGIEVTIITDNAAAWLMKKGAITRVIAGADRIAANGDCLGKIGTYSLALAAKSNNVPFYVAAHTYAVDKNAQTGESFPVEERALYEVATINGSVVVPEGIKIQNPVFDVTEASLITALITEKGVEKNLKDKGVLSIA